MAPVGTSARCADSQLRVTFGEHLSGRTEQIGFSFDLTNSSRSTCSVNGFPTITISDARGRVLPFVYDHDGNQMISGRAPKPVGLVPGAMAHVAIAHDSCVAGDKAIGSRVSVVAPGSTTSFRLTIPDGRYVSYCGAGDPGSTVYVSPVAATLRETRSN